MQEGFKPPNTLTASLMKQETGDMQEVVKSPNTLTTSLMKQETVGNRCIVMS
jgi:hypothetical protein